MRDIEREVLPALAEVSGRRVGEIAPSMHLVRDLELDSLKTLELLVSLEERLGVEISEVDAAAMVTVGDVLAFVQQKSPC